MRNVVTPNFCKVCVEGLWLRLLRRISIIENVDSACRSFGIHLLPLGQFRTNETLVATEERYEILWSRKREGSSPSITVSRCDQTFAGAKDRIFANFSGKTELVLNESDDVKPGDNIVVAVRFFTEEVRLDDEEYLHASVEWAVRGDCKSELTGV